MHHTLQPYTNHRLARLTTWALAWLEWLVRFWEGRVAEPMLRRWVIKHARDVGALLFLRAAARVEAPKIARPHHRFRKPRAGQLRSILGSRVRRMLGQGRLATRIAALRAVLRNPEPAIAILVKRLRRRFTRLGYFHQPAPRRIGRAVARAFALLAPDSS